VSYSDDWYERLSVLAFRGWRLIRPLLKATSSPRLANLYSVVGFALSILAIPLALIAWPGPIVATLGMFAGLVILWTATSHGSPCG
jgi:hypothetical protein